MRTVEYTRYRYVVAYAAAYYKGRGAVLISVYTACVFREKALPGGK